MGKISATFILVLFVVAFLNGYSVEGARRGAKLEKDDNGIYKSKKFGPVFDCILLGKLCLEFPLIFCPKYNFFCLHTMTTAVADAPKPQNLP
jgi:hypothetical protein